MDDSLGAAQAIKYAEGFRQLYADERAARRAAQDALVELQESYRLTVRALAAALELRDDATGEHAERVTELALELTARAAPELGADPQLEFGFLLHDIGKIGIPDQLLLKEGPLTPGELERMKHHTVLGERLLTGIPYLAGTAAAVAAAHHERWDGDGYPNGLRREEIPLPARIFAIVDSYDAITNDRPYRGARPSDEALEELRAHAGTQFEPQLVECFVELVTERGVP